MDIVLKKSKLEVIIIGGVMVIIEKEREIPNGIERYCTVQHVQYRTYSTARTVQHVQYVPLAAPQPL